jgi:hypothetical protein
VSRTRAFRYGAFLAGSLAALALAGLAAVGPLGAWAFARAGRTALDVPVTVDSGWPGWPPGTLSFHGLRVANPPGFRAEAAIAVETLHVRATPGGLLGDPLVVEEIVVSGALVSVLSREGRTNLRALHQRARAATGASEGRRIRVKRLRILGSRATSAPPGIGGPRLTVPVRDFEVRDLGGTRGATPAQLADAVLKLVEPGIGNALRRTDALGATGGALDKAGDAIKGLFR